MCTHQPPCPSAQATDHAFARIVARQDSLGWSLLCNKVIVFDDAGEILPSGTVIGPDRAYAYLPSKITRTGHRKTSNPARQPA